MATTVDTLLVRIEADMSDLKQKLGQIQGDVNKTTNKVSGSFKAMGTLVKGFIGVQLVQSAVQGGMAMINLASDIEEMQGKSKVVFGAFRDQVVGDLEAFGDAVGRSTFELEGMAASIQDTFVPMGFARGAAADLSVQLTKLAVDVASFNNASDTETMAAFQSALVGNHETVRRFGVIITESTLNLELMRMGIAKGTKEATEAQKVQARMNLIMAGTSDAHGDAARTAGSYANQSRALKAELSELAGELGTILLPTVNTIVAALTAAARATKDFLQSAGILKMPMAEEMALLTSDIEARKTAIAELKQEMADGSAPQNASALLGVKTRQQEDDLKRLRDLQMQIFKDAEKQSRQANRQFLGGNKTVETGSKAPTKAETDLANKIKEQNEEVAKSIGLTAYRTATELALNKAIEDGDKVAEKQHRTSLKLSELREKYPELAKVNIQALKDQASAEVNATMMLNEQAEAFDKAGKASEDYTAKIEDGLQYIKDNIRENTDLKETLADITAAYKAGKISVSEFKEAQLQIQEQMKETEPFYKSYKDAIVSMGEGVSSALADMVVNGKFSMESFKDLFKNMVKAVIAQAIQLMAVNRFLSFLFPGAYTQKGLAFIPTRATGGSMQPNTPTLVGERGPELFVPNTGGTIVNAANTRGALSGGGTTVVNQTINVSAGVSQTVRAEMMSLLPRFKQDTMAAVVDAKRRGGSFGQAFG